MIAANELFANAFNTASIVLAGRNSVHTWWCGITGCLLFGWVFFDAQLYADVTLQAFFIVTGIEGYRRWRGGQAHVLSITRTPLLELLKLCLAGALVVAGYGYLLHRFTDAFAPFADSAILAFSVLGQLLLVQRRIETWLCWLLVNTLGVPIYWQRGLHLTSILYAAYWLNAIVSWSHWRRELSGQRRVVDGAAA